MAVYFIQDGGPEGESVRQVRADAIALLDQRPSRVVQALLGTAIAVPRAPPPTNTQDSTMRSTIKHALRHAPPTTVDELLTSTIPVFGPPVYDFARTPRGTYLRAFRETLGLTMGSASRVLGLTVYELSGLEVGTHLLSSRAAWTRAEVELVLAAGEGWSGEAAGQLLRHAHATLLAGGGTIEARLGACAAAKNYVALAACQQIHTVKRGMLYALAGWIAIEADQAEDARYIAETGLSYARCVGDMPSWLKVGLDAVADATREIAVGQPS